MRKLLTLISLIIFAKSFAQVKERFYFDRNWLLSKKDSAVFYREADFDTVHYLYLGTVKDYTLQDSMIMFGSYLGKFKQGEFSFYYPTGKLESQGIFINDQRNGTWKYFYPNGTLRAEVEFLSSGYKVISYSDSTGKVLLRNGTGKWEERYVYAEISPPLRLINQGSYKNGKKDGKWICITEDGRKIYEETYRDGEFFGGYNFKTNGEKNEVINRPFKNHMNLPLELERPERLLFAKDVSQADYPFLKKLPPAPGAPATKNSSAVSSVDESSEVFTVVEQSAAPQCGMTGFYKTLGDIQRYPNEARRKGIQGRVFVEFIINKDGSLTDFQVLKGIGGGCEEEAVRCIMESQKTCPWKSGLQRGRPVRQRYTIPVIFRLG